MKAHIASARGFTVIELMTVIAVSAVLLTAGVSSFVDQIARRRLEGATIELSSDLQYARSQAVSTNSPVTLATNAGGTQYSIASASTTYKSVTLDSQLSFTPSVTITYDPLRAMATASGAMTLSSSRTSAQLQLTVAPVGRVSICTPSGSGRLTGYTAC